MKSYALRIYTDGSCEPNPGPGSWAFSYYNYHGERIFFMGTDTQTTNNRMELEAAIRALDATKDHPGHRTIISDSEYVVHGITKWIIKWKKKDWMLKKTKPVKNVDLWKRLDSLASGVDFEWVRGHSGNEMNEFVDGLCQTAREDMNHDPNKFNYVDLVNNGAYNLQT